MHFPETSHPFHKLDLQVAMTTNKSIDYRNHINVMKCLSSVLQKIIISVGFLLVNIHYIDRNSQNKRN
jgi:hypothetical protein